MKNKINIFELKFDAAFRKSFFEGSKKILDEGFLSNHTYVRKFEEIFKKKVGCKYAVAVNSGTAALELIFRSLNISGKKVLISSNTFVATGIAVQNAGGIPVPIDIDDQYFGICLKQLKKNISKKIGAVVIVHIAGLITPKMPEIVKICRHYKIPLVEDCAQSFNSSLDGKQAGTFGDASAFSLQTTKVLTAGEGGVALTNNKFLYEKLFSNRFYGLDVKLPLVFKNNGSNFKMSEFVALAAICDLKRSNQRINKRIKLAKRYQFLLKGSSFKALAQGKNSTTAYYKQVILSKFSRKKIELELNKKQITLTGGVYYMPLHRQQIIGIESDKLFPNASYFADNHFCPPCYPELKITDINYICKILLSIK